MKICVYAICKNEEKFVQRWLNSMSEADQIVVLDTGSTDHTVEWLKEGGAAVASELIIPWRFDIARNKSLMLVSKDIDVCVCTDLDEVFEPGWRKNLEKHWTAETKRGCYRYTWSFNPDQSEGIVFWTDKIHARHDFSWTHPVHEVLVPIKQQDYLTTYLDGVQLNHHPDPTKPRSQYLPLLELSVEECPTDDRNMHYLGREYMFYEQWEKCIETLKNHLALPTAVWKDERCASMRYIANAYFRQNNIPEAQHWLYRAVAEAPHLREPYIDLALLFYSQNDWIGTFHMAESALRITSRPITYINEPTAWGFTPYDLASLACYHLGLYERALGHINEAIRLNPIEERLKVNKKWIEDKIETPLPNSKQLL